jgi:hypothetical protein
MNKMVDNDGAKSSSEKTEEEPPFPLTDIDRWVLSQTDEEFHLHNWDELREIIGREIFISDTMSTFGSSVSTHKLSMSKVGLRKIRAGFHPVSDRRRGSRDRACLEVVSITSLQLG